MIFTIVKITSYKYILLNRTTDFKLKNCNKIKRSTKNRNENKKA